MHRFWFSTSGFCEIQILVTESRKNLKYVTWRVIKNAKLWDFKFLGAEKQDGSLLMNSIRNYRWHKEDTRFSLYSVFDFWNDRDDKTKKINK